MKGTNTGKSRLILLALLCGLLAIPVHAEANVADLLGALFGGSGIEKDEEAKRLGTVTKGELSIHLGDSREEIHEVLGEPEDERKMGSACMERYTGLGIFYRDYGKLSKKYSWIKSKTKQEGEDYRVAMISALPPEDVVNIVDPWRTADGFAIYDFSTKLEENSTVYLETMQDGTTAPCYYQTYYEGTYYSPEEWQKKEMDLRTAGNSDEYVKARIGMVRIWYTMDEKNNQISRIDVGDIMMAQMMQ